MKQIESQIQQSCVKWFRMVFTKYKNLLFSIPNEGQRNVINAARMKAQGIVSGVADLFLSIARGGFHGLYIEMKAPNGRQTNTQKAFEINVKEQGFKYVVCHSFDEFSTVINDYLINNCSDDECSN